MKNRKTLGKAQKHYDAMTDPKYELPEKEAEHDDMEYERQLNEQFPDYDDRDFDE